MPSLREEIVQRCPHEPILVDEASGVEVPNQRYADWIEGAVTGCEALVAVAEWHNEYLKAVKLSFAKEE